MRPVSAGALVLTLYVLHQDFWFWRDARPLVFGFLPIGLLYHAAFTAACAAVLGVLVMRAWPVHLEIVTPLTPDLEARPPSSPRDGLKPGPKPR